MNRMAAKNASYTFAFTSDKHPNATMAIFAHEVRFLESHTYAVHEGRFNVFQRVDLNRLDDDENLHSIRRDNIWFSNCENHLPSNVFSAYNALRDR